MTWAKGRPVTGTSPRVVARSPPAQCPKKLRRWFNRAADRSRPGRAVQHRCVSSDRERSCHRAAREGCRGRQERSRADATDSCGSCQGGGVRSSDWSALMRRVGRGRPASCVMGPRQPCRLVVTSALRNARPCKGFRDSTRAALSGNDTARRTSEMRRLEFLARVARHTTIRGLRCR